MTGPAAATPPQKTDDETRLRDALRDKAPQNAATSSQSDAAWVREVITQSQPSRIRLAYEGAQSVFSIGFRLMGVVFILTAPLMWFWPGSVGDVNTVTMKWGVSMFLLLCGLALFMRHHEDAQPEVEFDTNTREMRVCQRDTKGRWEIRFAYPFAGLSAIRLSGRVVQVENEDGAVVLRMRLRDRASEDVLRSLLADEFPELAA